MDYFDESLVFLRRLQCWRSKDILSLAPVMPDLGSKESQAALVTAVADLCPKDTELYQVLNNTFWRSVSL